MPLRDVEATLARAGSRPWANALAAYEQDAVWHAEGDVWTYTQLVCRSPATASTQARSNSRGPAGNFSPRSSDRAATTRRRKISAAVLAASRVIGGGGR